MLNNSLDRESSNKFGKQDCFVIRVSFVIPLYQEGMVLSNFLEIKKLLWKIREVFLFYSYIKALSYQRPVFLEEQDRRAFLRR